MHGDAAREEVRTLDAGRVHRKCALRPTGGSPRQDVGVIEEFERAYLSELLATHQGNISKAARAARKERRAFQRLLHKHGLDRRVFTAA